ncbi:uncharacterized protein LOC121651080 isoform X2 [Melanotaenia boesemani]|uniref:uncharacterized protein LOC121651080 isoform X2 n=1 Tax=Melanotaenia boesemani TaxID=1250792 RepID=UPI001C03AD1C|nr:uncharacterized protein LOC121651080 isoform X2 [Melanotaenia boesemani]XP_041858884.1 uncharacterized protein LOC121651080 isoform X2 [Melanotaenia boesemani]XP_041858885.1 uncharacterized protein LOC121651080 isoform X2 [Melanotaenia boesemani]
MFFDFRAAKLSADDLYRKGKACGIFDRVFVSSHSTLSRCNPSSKDANFPFSKVSVFLTIVVSFTYNILLNGDMECNCEDVVRDCLVHMFLPCGIFIFLILWTDKTCHQASKYTFACQINGKGKGYRKTFCCFLVARVIRAFCVGHLWVVSLFIDGDWYVCFAVYRFDQQKPLACLKKENMTAGEEMAIIQLKNDSRFFGYWLLFGLFFLGALASMCEWKRCCSGKRSQLIYDKLLLKEGHNELRETLRQAAKGELTRNYLSKIREGRWTECLDFTEELIEKSVKPPLSTQQTRELPEENRTIRPDLHQEPQQQGPAQLQPQPLIKHLGQQQPQPGEEDLVQQKSGEEDLDQQKPGEEDLGQQKPGEEDLDQQKPGEEDLGQQQPGEEDLGQQQPGEQDLELHEENRTRIRPDLHQEPQRQRPAQLQPQPVIKHLGQHQPGEEDLDQQKPGEEDLDQQKPGEEDLVQQKSGKEDLDQQKPGEEDLGQQKPGEEDLDQQKPGKEDLDQQKPGPAVPWRERPEPAEARRGRPGPAVPWRERPGSAEARRGRPGPAEARRGRPGPAVPLRERPGPAEARRGRPGPTKFI